MQNKFYKPEHVIDPKVQTNFPFIDYSNKKFSNDEAVSHRNKTFYD